MLLYIIKWFIYCSFLFQEKIACILLVADHAPQLTHDIEVINNIKQNIDKWINTYAYLYLINCQQVYIQWFTKKNYIIVFLKQRKYIIFKI